MWGGANNVLGLRFCTIFVYNVFCTWVDTLHVTLDTSSELGLTHFTTVGHVFCTSVNTLHVTCGTSSVLRLSSINTLHVTLGTSSVLPLTHHFTLDTSSVLRLPHFILRWTRLLYLGWHTSCYKHIQKRCVLPRRAAQKCLPALGR